MFGHSSGGVLALAGAIAGLPVDRVAIYETPFRVDGNREVPPAGHFERLTALLRAGDRDGAAALFLTENVGVPAEMVDHMRAGEGWDFMVQGAEGLPYDVLLLGPDLEFPAAGLSALTVPVLALYGDQTWPWLAEATKAVARTVPGARLVEVPGEDHGVLAHPEALRPALVEFLSS